MNLHNVAEVATAPGDKPWFSASEQHMTLRSSSDSGREQLVAMLGCAGVAVATSAVNPLNLGIVAGAVVLIVWIIQVHGK
ncbi:hypothetical protein [Sorangium sp. So ce1000]|uniref:hypothetical protein n=1 Tax=Sorangium sp. So ce1000 TaxID=3133325 RepID=UPI003F6240E4